MVRRLFLVMATLGLCVCAVDSQVRRQTQPRTGIELRGGDRERQNNFRKAVGVRYPSRSELGAIAATGYNFASIELGSRSPEEWEPAVKRAESLNLQLLVGIWPLPWRYNNNGTWTANPEGIQFLRLMRQYPKTVIGMYGFNEPYWTNPATGRNDFECGFYTAADLRSFRRMIRSYWP